jgi:hypothetical protein
MILNPNCVFSNEEVNNMVEKKQPLISARSRGISIALFNPYQDGQSKSIVLQKSWKKGDKYERRSLNIFAEDFPNFKEAVLDFIQQYEQLK